MRAVNAQLLIMLVTRRHAKHMQNYEYLKGPESCMVFKKTRVGKCDEVIKYSAPMFSSFLQCFAEFMQ